MASVFSLHMPFAGVDYSAVGGYLLLLDLCLFTTVASFWDAAGQTGRRVGKRRNAPRR